MQTFKTYTVRILEPDPTEDSSAAVEDRERKTVARILNSRFLRDVEDYFGDTLPLGWQAKVSEWDR